MFQTMMPLEEEAWCCTMIDPTCTGVRRLGSGVADETGAYCKAVHWKGREHQKTYGTWKASVD